MTSGAGVGGAGTMAAGSGDPEPPEPPLPPAVPQGTELAQQTGHVAGGLDLLIEQFKRKDAIEAILESWLAQVQDLEDAQFDLLQKRLNIDNSEGVQLDRIGTIVVESRGGKTDARYRIFLKARIAINRSKGRVEEIYEVMRQILVVAGNPTLPVLKYTLDKPAAFTLLNDAELLIAAADAAKILGDMTGSGIRSLFHFLPSPPAETFTFASSAVPELGDPLQGFANIGQTTGGKFSGVREAAT